MSKKGRGSGTPSYSEEEVNKIERDLQSQSEGEWESADNVLGSDREVKSIFVLELKQSCIICRHFMNFGDRGFCYRDYNRNNADKPVVEKGVQSVSVFTNKDIKGVRCVERSEMDKHCPYFEIEDEYKPLLISKERIEHEGKLGGENGFLEGES